MTATRTEIERLDLTEHEFEVCCDLGGWPPAECTNPARWSMLRRCCGTAVFACDGCKEVRLNAGADEAYTCAYCSVSMYPPLYMAIEPLRKS